MSEDANVRTYSTWALLAEDDMRKKIVASGEPPEWWPEAFKATWRAAVKKAESE